MYEYDDYSIRVDYKEAFRRCGVGFILMMVVLAALLLFVNTAKASTIKIGRDKAIVKVLSSDVTVFRFPKAVQTISGAQRLEIKPANPTDPDYAALAVRPRLTTGTNDLVFVLNDGRLVKVQVIVTTKADEAQGFYDFIVLESQNTASTAGSPESDLLRAMLNGKIPNGYSVQEKKEKVSSFLSSLRIELVRVVKGGDLTGYVYQLTNTSWSKNVKVDLSQLTLGTPDDAILSQVDDDELFPKGKGSHQTYLRVVAKARSDSSDIVLPVELLEPKTESQDKK